MDENQVGKKRRARRTAIEVQRLVEEFISGGMTRSEFCRTRGLTPGTLLRHLKGGKQKAEQTPRLVAVELEEKAAEKANAIEVVLALEAEELKCVLDLTRRRCKPSSRSWKGYKPCLESDLRPESTWRLEPRI